jgi:hypothetical protein
MPINLTKKPRLEKTAEAQLRKRIWMHSKRQSMHSKLAHKRREELLNMVPEEKRESMRRLLGDFADRVRFQDAAQRKMFELTEKLKEHG